MNLNLGQLELSITVARVKNITRAANLLHLTQPAVSNQIRAMEEYYGTALFSRTKQGVELTPAGKVIYDHAREILSVYERMERALDELAEPENQKLALGASASVGNYVLLCSIWTFKEKYPQAKIELKIANDGEIIELVRDNQIDLGIIEGPPPSDPAIEKKALLNDKLVGIVAANSLWENRTCLEREDFLYNSLIVREKGSAMRHYLEAVLRGLDLQLKDLPQVIELGSLDAVKSAVEKGMGISICSQIAVKKELHNGLIMQLPVANLSNSVPYNIIWRKNSYHSALAQRFLRFLDASGQTVFC